MKIKCVSLNLWWGYLLPGILAFLREQDADILLLQEVYNGTDPLFVDNYRLLTVLRNKLSYQFYSFAPATINILEIGKIETGNAILSKFPITDTDIHFFNEPFGEHDAYDPKQRATMPRNLQHAVITTPEETLNVYNLQGVYDLNGDNYSESRRRMSETIIKNIDGKENVILAGDTNAKPTNKAMRSLEAHLTNVFGESLTTTFNMRRKENPGYATAVVDLMYISPNIQVIDKTCPDVDISDHLPLVATFEITSNKEG